MALYFQIGPWERPWLQVSVGSRTIPLVQLDEEGIWTEKAAALVSGLGGNLWTLRP